MRFLACIVAIVAGCLAITATSNAQWADPWWMYGDYGSAVVPIELAPGAALTEPDAGDSTPPEPYADLEPAVPDLLSVGASGPVSAATLTEADTGGLSQGLKPAAPEPHETHNPQAPVSVGDSLPASVSVVVAARPPVPEPPAPTPRPAVPDIPLWAQNQPRPPICNPYRGCGVIP